MNENLLVQGNRKASRFSNLKLLLGAIVIILFSACQDKNYTEVPEESEKAEEKELSQEELVSKGKYLVEGIGCMDCHSPKKMGPKGPEYIPELAYSGYQASNNLPEIPKGIAEKGWMLMNHDLTAAVGPWGVSFAANLTSDETGIGTWSLDQFKTSLREGKFKGMKSGRPLLPPMPWENYAKLSDEDLEAMFAYFKSTKPVKNAVPPPIPPTQLDSLKQG
jgi:hypothetical protein